MYAKRTRLQSGCQNGINLLADLPCLPWSTRGRCELSLLRSHRLQSSRSDLGEKFKGFPIVSHRNYITIFIPAPHHRRVHVTAQENRQRRRRHSGQMIRHLSRVHGLCRPRRKMRRANPSFKTTHMSCPPLCVFSAHHAPSTTLKEKSRAPQRLRLPVKYSGPLIKRKSLPPRSSAGNFLNTYNCIPR